MKVKQTKELKESKILIIFQNDFERNFGEKSILEKEILIQLSFP